MKITIITSGSRGDVEPYVALAEGLKASSHVVKIATEAPFEQLVKERGIEYALVAGNTQAAINSKEGQKALDKPNNTTAFFKHLVNTAAPLATQILKQTLEASKNAEHLICTPFTLHTAYLLSKEFSIPVSIGSVNPWRISPTKYFHNPMFPAAWGWLPGFAKNIYNMASHGIVDGMVWKNYLEVYKNAWKEVAGKTLPAKDPVVSDFMKTLPLSLYAYSPQMLPKPNDWKPTQFVTGYWFLKEPTGWKPPRELENFIESGTKPIYIGFGSMNSAGMKQGKLKTLVLETIRQTKQRAVVLNQGLDFDKNELQENIFYTQPVPFSYLFPKMAAVIHHGGAGTTAAGLRAGVPSILTPLIAEQKFWAWRVEKSGVGPKPIPWRQLSTNGLVHAIQKATSDKNMQAKAFGMGKRIREEKGVEEAVAIFNSLYNNK